MFTGIIEQTGLIESVAANGTNKTFRVRSPLSAECRVDQSVSHNGVCLTVEAVSDGAHQVTAIEETLTKSNLGLWQPGTRVNLERCMRMDGRLDGHMVQGHVDTTAVCLLKEDHHGSWLYRFGFPGTFAGLVIEKGAIALNGISLTIFDVSATEFTVAIIPYTYEHTNLKEVDVSSSVNLEFDMIGKYILRNLSLQS